MFREQMSDKKSIYRKVAALVGLFMVLTLLLSAAFIAKEAGHDCSGEDCPVCAVIAQCENTIRRIGSGLIPVIAAVAVMLTVLQLPVLYTSMAQAFTPVSQKVRMNN